MPAGERKSDYGSIEAFWDDLIALFLENSKDTLICEVSSPDGRVSFFEYSQKVAEKTLTNHWIILISKPKTYIIDFERV